MNQLLMLETPPLSRPRGDRGRSSPVKFGAFAKVTGESHPHASTPAPFAPRSTIAKQDISLEASHKRSLELALAAARTAEENRGTNIVLLDMRQVTPVFDYFVIATGNSRRQLHAISDEIERTIKEELKDKRLGSEGYDESRWILLDYGNVVIHLFDEETRDFYALEDFWSQAERVKLPSDK